jgi:hypothetical protein
MSYSPAGLLQLAASNQPVSAAQVAAAVDTPRDRAQLRTAVEEVSGLRRAGANKAARELARELSADFAEPEDARAELVNPSDLADAFPGRRPVPPGAEEQPDPSDPAELASRILDRRRT